MAKHTSRGARLTALALATGTLVVAATGPAGAAPVAVPDVFGGSARGTAIHVEINLPTPIPLPAPLNGEILSLTQDISFVEGNATKGVAPKPVSVAKAVLGSGKTVVLGNDALSAVNNLLARSVTASLDGNLTASDALVKQDLGVLSVGVGNIESSVAPENGGQTGLGSKSSASLLDFRVGLGSLTDSLPVKADLETVTDALDDVVGEEGLLTTTINNALATIDEATEGASAPVTAQVQEVKKTLTGLLEQLTTTLTDLSADTDLIRIGLLKSTEEIIRSGDAITAKATAEIGGLNILGGLVSVEAAKTVSSSTANGRKGSAAADSDTDVLRVKVSDVLELDLGTDGLTGKLLGQDLPAAVNDAFQTVLTTLNGVLATAGVEILEGKKTSSVDPNGQYASSSSEGIGIVVNPLKLINPNSKPLVLVQLVPAGTAVNAARVDRATPPRTPGRITNPGQPRGPLPHTGGELPLFALIGTGLAGAALVARRRRTVEA